MSRKSKPRDRKPLPADPDQEFLVRGRQLQIIRDCVLPGIPGVVKGIVMKAVLRALDDHLGRNKECWPSQDTLAREAGLKDRKQVQRAVQGLADLSLVYVRRGPKPGRKPGSRETCNFYRIIWNELALLCPAEPIHEKCEPSGGDQWDSTVPLIRSDQSDNSGVSMGQFTPINGTVLSQEAPITEPTKNRPPPPKPPRQLPAEWAAVADDFCDRQSAVAELAAEQLAAGATAAEFRTRLANAWAVVELPENRGKFARPAGAVAWHVRQGTWPVDGVVTLDRVEQLRESQRARAAAFETATIAADVEAIAEANRETIYGELLDTLSEDELQQLIRATPKLQDDFYQRWLKRRPPAGPVRELLLKTLAETFDERKSP